MKQSKIKATTTLIVLLMSILIAIPAMVLADASADKVYGKDKASGLTSLDNVYTTGQQFTIRVIVVNPAGVMGASVAASWDPAVLSCVSVNGSYWLANGPLPTSFLLAIPGTIDNVAGTISPAYGWSRTDGGELADSGEQVLADIVFQVLAQGSTWINISAVLTDSLGTETVPTIENVWFNNVPPAPDARGATVGISQIPVSSPGQIAYYLFNGTTVTFTATVVEQAFDNVSMTYYDPNIYEWTILHVDSMTETKVNTTAPTMDFTFTALGAWEISVQGIVEAMQTNFPSLVRSNIATIGDTVVLPPMGPLLDAYSATDRWPGYTTTYIGEGADVPCDAYSYDELVQLYANLTYNGGELQTRLVVWEIRDPNGIVRAVRTSYTNSTGTATTDFRIMTICGDIEASTGLWNVTVRSTVGEVTVEDTIAFKVNYIVDTTEMYPTVQLGNPDPTNTFVKGSDVYAKVGPIANWAFTPRNATVVVTIYDELGVPVATGQLELNPLMGRRAPATAPLPGDEWYCTPGWVRPEGVMFILTIPKWAYTGTGTVVASVLTAPISQGGVAWCPEVSTPIIITNA